MSDNSALEKRLSDLEWRLGQLAKDQSASFAGLAQWTKNYEATRKILRGRCGIGSCGVSRPSLAGYVTGTGHEGVPTAAAC